MKEFVAGFGGNDFFDVSVIVGAGGNMTVQQVNDPSTRKGDPHFMQNLNTAWAKLDGNRRNALKNCVHERNGKVVRIDAPKNFPELEKFVRTFANGKLYIGVGAWGGSKGNAADNAQVCDDFNELPSLPNFATELTRTAELGCSWKQGYSGVLQRWRCHSQVRDYGPDCMYITRLPRSLTYLQFLHSQQ